MIIDLIKMRLNEEDIKDTHNFAKKKLESSRVFRDRRRPVIKKRRKKHTRKNRRKESVNE